MKEIISEKQLIFSLDTVEELIFSDSLIVVEDFIMNTGNIALMKKMIHGIKMSNLVQ